jgi:hypothetical protein
MSAEHENVVTRMRYKGVMAVKGAVNLAGLNGEMCVYTTAMVRAGFGTDQINVDPCIGIMVVRMAELCGLTIDLDEKLELYRKFGELLPKLLPIEGMDTVK